jgi:hypothetical protein
MPQIAFSRSIAAGATDTPMAGTTYEFLPFPAHVRIMQKTTATGVTQQVFSGSESIMDPSPVTVLLAANFPAGFTPNELNVHPFDFDAPAGDRIRISNLNTTAGALVVDTVVIITPLA